MNEKLPAPCDHCRATGLFHGSSCSECGCKGYRVIIDRNREANRVRLRRGKKKRFRARIYSPRMMGESDEVGTGLDASYPRRIGINKLARYRMTVDDEKRKAISAEERADRKALAASEAQAAMADYQSSGIAARQNLDRLRTLRLARQSKPPAGKPSEKKTSKNGQSSGEIGRR